MISLYAVLATIMFAKWTSSPLDFYKDLVGTNNVNKWDKGSYAIQILPSNRDIDVDILGQLDELKINAEQVSAMYFKVVAKDGSEILRQKMLLVSKTSADDIDVSAMSLSLHAARASFSGVKDAFLSIQLTVHVIIENCRERTSEYEKQINNNIAEKKSLENEIESKGKEIERKIEDARDYDARANHAEYLANKHESDGEGKFVFGVLGGILGGVITYATAWLGPLYAGAAYLGVNTVRAVADFSEADNSRKKAGDSRYRAESLRQEVNHIKIKIEILETKIVSIQSRVKHTEKIKGNIGDLLAYLNTGIKDLDNVMAAMQDVDILMKDAAAQTDTFEILQWAFNRNPGQMESRMKTQMQDLKLKWERLEDALALNKAVSVRH